MKYRSDIEIARSAKKIPIADVAKKLGNPYEDIVPYGHDIAKISDNFFR